MVNAHVVLSVAVLKQGKQFDDIPDLFSLAELPIFLS
jgi:hypothetical protein